MSDLKKYVSKRKQLDEEFSENYENSSFSLRGGARGRFARFSEYAKNSIYIREI